MKMKKTDKRSSLILTTHGYLTSSETSLTSSDDESSYELPPSPNSDCLHDNYGYGTPTRAHDFEDHLLSLRLERLEAPSPTDSLNDLDSWLWCETDRGPDDVPSIKTPYPLYFTPIGPSPSDSAENQPGEVPPSPRSLHLAGKREKPNQVKNKHAREDDEAKIPSAVRFIFGVLMGISLAVVLQFIFAHVFSYSSISSGPSDWGSRQGDAEHVPSYLKRIHDRSVNYTAPSGQVWRLRTDTIRLGRVVDTDAAVPDVYQCIEKCEVETWCAGVNFVTGPAEMGKWCEKIGEWNGNGGMRFLASLVEWTGASCAERIGEEAR